MRTGSCKYCGHTPVAHNALICPRCSGDNPCPYTSLWEKVLAFVVGVPMILFGALVYLTYNQVVGGVIAVFGLLFLLGTFFGWGGGRSVDH